MATRSLKVFLILSLWTVWPGSLTPGFAQTSTATFLSEPARQAPGTFTNPIGNGADPWVVKHAGYYYTCSSGGIGGGKSGISVTKSSSLTRPGKKVRVWTSPDDSWNSHSVWAPELHRIGNRWYIYYAAGKSGAPFIYQRSGVLESLTDDPQGEYIDRGVLKTGHDPADYLQTIWAIDVTVAQIGGQQYAIWSGWERNADTDKTPQHLYIAKMSNPYTISSERVKISSPVEPWETGGPLDLNEGPQVLQRNGKTFIIYSTRESWTKEYRLGMLMLKESAEDPMRADSWLKTGPVFEGTDEVYGVGHASFTTSPDGREWWIYYHAKKDTVPGWNRDVRLQKFDWDKNGKPVFGRPIPAGVPMKLPSGEKQAPAALPKRKHVELP